MDRFLLMTCFARAVETGSFSAAGRDLGIGQPNVSRNVAALEDHLQTRLLNRSTRALNLTPEGERYYAEVKRILDAVADSEASLLKTAEPTGLLRVACPTTLAHVFVMPQVATFLALYPALSLDLQLSDRYAGLIDEGLELALRIGHLEDSALRARRVGAFRRVCVASPDYLVQRGTPRTPADLRQHECVIYTLLASGHTWRFKSGEVPVSGRFRVSSPEAVRDAAIAGLGISHGPQWLFNEAINDGRLLRVLADEDPSLVPIQILYVANRLLSRRAVVFIDFISDLFAAIPGLNPEIGSNMATA